MLSDIIALVKAGFTAEQIMQLASAPAYASAKAPEPAEENPASAKPTEAPAPVAVTPAPEALSTDELLSEIKALRQTVSDMQAANARCAEQPVVKQTTVEEILQGYLNGGSK